MASSMDGSPKRRHRWWTTGAWVTLTEEVAMPVRGASMLAVEILGSFFGSSFTCIVTDLIVYADDHLVVELQQRCTQWTP